MPIPKILDSEYKFCLILWENEPINSTALAKLCAEKLGWKRSTTYTVIRRLIERGIIKNERAIVSSIVSKQQAEDAAIDNIIEKTFSGSMPAFVAAFTRYVGISNTEEK